jgi:hypothetical protein
MPKMRKRIAPRILANRLNAKKALALKAKAANNVLPKMRSRSVYSKQTRSFIKILIITMI